MRLVSACYEDWYPFDGMGLFDKFFATNDAEDLREGDVLVVWGGGDIPPEYYGKGRSSKSYAGNEPSRRDRIEWALVNRAKELGLPMIGVCRGAQMMCAAAGGYLVQHVNGHGGNHVVQTIDGKEFITNSIHHQMMFPGDAKHENIAVMPTPRSQEYWDVDVVLKDVDMEREYIYFNDIKAHAIQWHPEGMHLHSAANVYIKEQLEKTLL